MNDRKVRLAAGGLLHDTGKLLYRYNDGRNHSTSGADLLKEIIPDKDIIDCVRYHHKAMLRNSGVADDALCYITYIADNISAFSDRRKNETGDSGFVKDISCESVFNVLNGNHGRSVYRPVMLTERDEINFPTEDDIRYSEEFYGKVIDTLKNALKGVEMTADYINSLLEVFEACTSYIPSSTQTGELRDISLYDHVKLTASLSLCIYDYLEEKGITDLKKTLFDNEEKFYDEKAFMIYSADISGIQKFIYNISSSHALKSLRSRSFYLELMMENAVDTLLDSMELCRCNVIYTGGGHTYIILPATEKALLETEKFERSINRSAMEYFGTQLYIGGGHCICSANDLRNKPEGSYKNIFANITKNISQKKINRYSAEEIIRLNSASSADSERECAVCMRSDRLTELDGKFVCEICAGLFRLSDSITDSRYSGFFTVRSGKSDNGVPMPPNSSLVSDSDESLRKRMKNDDAYVRSYSKNMMNTGKRIASKMWVADYCSHKVFEELADKSTGIKRLGVLRADVDNLGNAFVNGFSAETTTISRTAEFSSKLSLFFKHDINHLFKNGEFYLKKKDAGTQRNAAVIYSGGDDVFVVGSWDDVVGFAVDLDNALRRFSQGTLTISAGIGLFSPTYPVSSMADMTGELEEISKHNDKDSITLFSKENCYHWDEFSEKVVGEKLALLNGFLDENNEKGNSMLYNMLSLIRQKNDENRLNIARFAYLLARLAPHDDGSEKFKEKYEQYSSFKSKMYSWIQNEDDCRQLITAIYLYVYLNRERNEDDE